MEERKLYRIENGIGDFYVIATNPTEAEEKLVKLLNKQDYGFTSKRKTKGIFPIAEEVVDKLYTGKNLIL